MAGVVAPSSATTIPHATCLGCGCACDDIEVAVSDGRIAGARRACALGASWFGDGHVPGVARVDGSDRPVDDALAAAAHALAGARRPLIYLAPGLSCEAQRAAVALADRLHAAIDSVSSATVLPSILAAQERGRAGATLGELRNRADVVVYWAVDPGVSYPRFRERYADLAGPPPQAAAGTRTVLAVDVGGAHGPPDAGHRFTVAPGDEVAVLTATAALLTGAPGSEAVAAGAAAAPAGGQACGAGTAPTSVWRQAEALVAVMRAGAYVAVVADSEPSDDRDPGRASALVSLSQALNAATRGALVSLRAGGNRSGADSVLTSQTGYPLAVDFTHGSPRYRPHDGEARARLLSGAVDRALVVGDAALVPAAVAAALAAVPVVTIGPRASEAPLGSRDGIVVDAGQAGVHEAGTALRMDDVPLPLRALVPGPPGVASLLRAILARVEAASHGTAVAAGGGVAR
jgi:formylmethanofuran dehydrogenase subunit B